MYSTVWLLRTTNKKERVTDIGVDNGLLNISN